MREGGKSGKWLSVQKDSLQQVLDGARGCTGEQTLERIFDDVNEFAAEVPQFDDITMVVLTIK